MDIEYLLYLQQFRETVGSILTPLMNAVTKPVSYTHLDVYKRQVVISTDQEKEDIMNILNELEEEFPGLVSDDVKANAGELVAKYQ